MNKLKSFVLLLILFSPFYLKTGLTMSGINKIIISSDQFIRLVDDRSRSPNEPISGFILSNVKLQDLVIENTIFRDCEFIGSEAQHAVLKNVTFENCEFKDGSWKNSYFEKVSFIESQIQDTDFNGSTLSYVKFQKSEIKYTSGNPFKSFKNIKSDSISFEESKLFDLNFYDVEANFFFTGSELTFVNIFAKNKSTISIDNSKLKGCDFSDSDLNSFTAIRSTIENSKLNDSVIQTIFLDNNTFERFPIASKKTYGSVKVTNTSEVTVHGTGPVKSVYISDCNRYKEIYISEMEFEDAVIENCKTPRFTSFDIKGSTLKLSNMEIHELDLEDAEIGKLILDNVTIEGKIYAKNAKVNSYEAHNVTVLDGVVYKDEGANFKIISAP